MNYGEHGINVPRNQRDDSTNVEERPFGCDHLRSKRLEENIFFLPVCDCFLKWNLIPEFNNKI